MKTKDIEIYLAGPFFNPEQIAGLRFVENLLEEHGINFWSPRAFGNLPEHPTDADLKKVYEMDIFHLVQCNFVLAMHDYEDSGTMLEIGYKSVPGVRGDGHIVTYSLDEVYDENKPINLMIQQSVDAHIPTKERLEKFIKEVAAREEINFDFIRTYNKHGKVF